MQAAALWAIERAFGLGWLTREVREVALSELILSDASSNTGRVEMATFVRATPKLWENMAETETVKWDDSAKPTWDCDKRKLYHRGKTIAEYTRTAGNQTRVLAAFQEAGWPDAIDDPLPPRAGINYVDRVNSTAKRLTEACRGGGLSFGTNGSGTGFTWREA